MDATINAGEIARRRFSNPLPGYYVLADTEHLFPIVALTDLGPIVEGIHTHALGLVVKTGRKVSNEGLVRCRIDFAVDLGDVEGTLSFRGHSVGGQVNFRAFEH
jgi:hypothetical protein